MGSSGQAAKQQSCGAHVGCRSFASFSTPSNNVGSYPNNGQIGDPLRRSKRANNRREQVKQKSTLLDHLVSKRQQVVRELQSERLGGFQIDRHLEFGGLQHRQLGRVCAAENLADIDAHLAVHVGKT
jgi:hypothetical protein